MVFFVSSILLASRKLSLLHCLPSTGQDWLWSGLTHLGGLVHFLVQKGTKRPAQACRNYSFCTYCYVLRFFSGVQEPSFWVCEKTLTWDTAWVLWPQGFLGSSPSAGGAQETLGFSKSGWRFGKRRALKADRLGFKAQLPCLLAVLFWVHYVTSLSLWFLICDNNS